MPGYRKILSHLINYIPSLIVLVFSMLALHFSIVIIEDYKKVSDLQALHTATADHEHGFLYDSHDDHQSRVQKNLYWAVIAVGLAGFILVLLNTDKQRKLRKATEEEKKNRVLLEERLAAMEATLDGIGIIDAQGKLAYMNRALMDLHQIKPGNQSEFIGKDWTSIFDEQAREEILHSVLPVLETKKYWRGEIELVQKNEQRLWAEFSLTKVDDGGLVCTVRDITEKRRARKEREDLQSQLYQAQKMEALGRLAGGIAHDFNNILAAMNGYSEFLIEDLTDRKPQQKFAKNILQAGQQARELVDQILAFSRRRDSSFENVDLVEAVGESISMLNASLPKTIELKTDMGTGRAMINANPTQISQTIMNLCVNAKDAMESDKGVLDIRLKIVDGDFPELQGLVENTVLSTGNEASIKLEEMGTKTTRLMLGSLNTDQSYICLSIADTGTGMSKATMEHVLEPFFTTKPVEKGTGLGLATVHGVVVGHKGAMIITSTLGQGTNFELFFPLSEQQENMQANDAPVQIVSVGANILIVEDQAHVRDMMINMLERIGHTPFACETGLEALDFLREHVGKIDLVITDQNMPKMTGFEMITEAAEDFPDLPFIVLSGYSEKKLQSLMEGHPSIKTVLRKPVPRNILQQEIAKIISGKKAQRRRA